MDKKDLIKKRLYAFLDDLAVIQGKVERTLELLVEGDEEPAEEGTMTIVVDEAPQASVGDPLEVNDLTNIPGIGKATQEKLENFCDIGDIASLVSADPKKICKTLSKEFGKRSPALSKVEEWIANAQKSLDAVESPESEIEEVDPFDGFDGEECKEDGSFGNSNEGEGPGAWNWCKDCPIRSECEAEASKVPLEEITEEA